MEKIDNNYILVILGVVAIIIEIVMGVATGFDLLLVGVILIISGGLGILTKSFVLALVSTAILSFLYVVVGRKLIKNKLTIVTKATNSDNLIGRKCLVTKKIFVNKPGQVKIEGEIWRASSEHDINEGTEVVIHSISGVTLKVLETAK